MKQLPIFYLITPDFNADQYSYLKALETSLKKGLG